MPRVHRSRRGESPARSYTSGPKRSVMSGLEMGEEDLASRGFPHLWEKARRLVELREQMETLQAEVDQVRAELLPEMKRANGQMGLTRVGVQGSTVRLQTTRKWDVEASSLRAAMGEDARKYIKETVMGADLARDMGEEYVTARLGGVVRSTSQLAVFLGRMEQVPPEGSLVEPLSQGSVRFEPLGFPRNEPGAAPVSAKGHEGSGAAPRCTIFRDPGRNARAIQGGRQALGTYYPMRGRTFEELDEYSRTILDLKDNRPDAIEYFVNRLGSILSREEYVVCPVPSHLAGGAREGMKTLVRRLCTAPLIDGTGVLVRNTDVPRKSQGGERGLTAEVRSLRVEDRDLVRGRQVLVLDDVTTSGDSLQAGKIRLDGADPLLVAQLALGITDGWT